MPPPLSLGLPKVVLRYLSYARRDVSFIIASCLHVRQRERETSKVERHLRNREPTSQPQPPTSSHSPRILPAHIYRQRARASRQVDKMPGFDFSNHNRNIALHAAGVPLPKATSTGTTIVGALYDGGVVIAADTRATSGPIVADKVPSLPSTIP